MPTATMPGGFAHCVSRLSAFQRLPYHAGEPSDSVGVSLLPLDTHLLPFAFSTAFDLPAARCDQSGLALSSRRVAQAFKIPLPFVGSSGGGSSKSKSLQLSGKDAPIASKRLTLAVTGTTQDTTRRSLEPPADQASKVPKHTLVAQMTHEVEGGEDGAKPLHKPRVVWTEELHDRFLNAIDAAGSDEAAVPTVILKLMNVSGLSRDNVASHLQKHRLGLKRGRTRKRRAAEEQGSPMPSQRRKTAASSPKAKPRRKLVGTVQAQRQEDFAAAAVQPTVQATAAEEQAAAQRAEDATKNPANDELWNDHEGSNDREGSNTRPNHGSCDQDRRGSNTRDGSTDREASNDGPGSDDGAGAGSDNRNSTCLGAAAADPQLQGANPPFRHVGTAREAAGQPPANACTPAEGAQAMGAADLQATPPSAGPFQTAGDGRLLGSGRAVPEQGVSAGNRSFLYNSNGASAVGASGVTAGSANAPHASGGLAQSSCAPVTAAQGTCAAVFDAAAEAPPMQGVQGIECQAGANVRQDP